MRDEFQTGDTVVTPDEVIGIVTSLPDSRTALVLLHGEGERAFHIAALRMMPPGLAQNPQDKCLLCGRPGPGRWNGREWVCPRCSWVDLGFAKIPGHVDEYPEQEPVHGDANLRPGASIEAAAEPAGPGEPGLAQPQHSGRDQARAKLTIKCGEGTLLEVAYETPVAVTRLQAGLLGEALSQAILKTINTWRWE